MTDISKEIAKSFPTEEQPEAIEKFNPALVLCSPEYFAARAAKRIKDEVEQAWNRALESKSLVKICDMFDEQCALEVKRRSKERARILDIESNSLFKKIKANVNARYQDYLTPSKEEYIDKAAPIRNE